MKTKPEVRKGKLWSHRELLDRIEELEVENEALQSKLDEILDIVAPPEEHDEKESCPTCEGSGWIDKPKKV